MPGELMVIRYNTKDNYNKRTREVNIRQEAARTGLKVKDVCVEDILQRKIKPTDPCIVLCTHGDFFVAMEQMYPEIRKINFTEMDETFCRVSTVRHNIHAMANDIIEYLVAAGRKRIALFGLDRDSVYTRSTLKAFQDAAERFSVPMTMNEVFMNDTTLEQCFEMFARVMHRYDSVVCVNDYAAAFLSTHLQNRGVRVPEDMFIVGRGNAMISAELNPTITTIDYMEEDVGREAISLYWHLLRHPAVLRAEAFVQHKLVIRRSTDNIPVKKLVMPERAKQNVVFEDRGYDELMRLEDLLMSDKVNRDILRMLGTKTTAQMAEALFMSESTVKYRIGNIARILGVKNRREVLGFLQKYHLSVLDGKE